MPLFENAADNSDIIKIFIPDADDFPTYLIVHDANGRQHVYRDEEIYSFIQQCEKNKDNPAYKISVDLLATLKEKYSHIVHDIAQNERFSHVVAQDEVNELYEKLYYAMLKKKQEALQSGKPLLILLGEEHHNSESSLFIEMTLQIAASLGIKTLQLELTPELLSHDPLFKDYHTTYNILPLENEADRKRFIDSDREHKVSDAKKKAALQSRDEAMSDRLIDIEKKSTTAKRTARISQSYTSDRLEAETSPKPMMVDYKFIQTQMEEKTRRTSVTTYYETQINPVHQSSIGIVGSAHLKGIVENKDIQAHFEVLPINISGKGKRSYDQRAADSSHLATDRETRTYYLDPSKVMQLSTQRGGKLDKMKLKDMVVMANTAFNKRETEVLQQEATAVLKCVNPALDSDNFTEYVIAANLDKVIKGILQAKTPAHIKRFELHAAVDESIELLNKKNLSESNFYKDLMLLKTQYSQPKEKAPDLTRSELGAVQQAFRTRTPRY